MASYNTVKYFSDFRGLDLSSSDLARDTRYSSGNLNADGNDTGALVKRKGYQYITESFGGFGMGIYENVNTTTGAITEEVVSLDDSLFKLVSDSFNITYSGSGAAALLNIYVDATTNLFKLTLDVDTVNILTQNLKVGMNEASATTIATVITAIDALADFAASGGTLTTGSAAFLELHDNTVLSSTATAVDFQRWSQINEPTANPLTTTLTYKNNTDFENASFANLSDCLYVSTSYDSLMKYDGQGFYKAGMPAGGDADGSGDAGVAPTTAEDGAGNLLAGQTYYYFYTYEQKDAKGNIVEGIQSPYSALETIAAANTDVDVTVTNLLAASGFNTGCAKVNGNQGSVTTINVDSGHTLLAGDTAYLYNGSAYVEKPITSVTATTIVVSGAVVTVVDDAIISNNLRINVYRTKTAPVSTLTASYYLLATIPNNSLTATQAWKDTLTDANVGADFIPPVKAHGLPPKGRYLTTFRNQLFISGIPTNVNAVKYSDINNPEYFPAADNEILVDAFEGTKVRGLGTLDTAVVVFKDLSILSVTGDIGNDNFRVDELSYGSVGTVAHHSIQKIRGSLFFLANSGVYKVDLKGVQDIGARIKPEFTKAGVSYNLRKAVSVNWSDNNKYILFVTDETLDASTNYYANSNSTVYVYDYRQDAWLLWDNINAQGGFAYSGGILYFCSRRLDTDSLATEFHAAKFNKYGNLNDFSDHEKKITFEYSTAWITMGDPSVFKKFLRLKVFALPSDVLSGNPSLFTLNVEQEINFITPAPIATFTMDFSGGSSGYDSAGYDETPYGDEPLPELKAKLKSSKSRALRLILKNDTIRQDILISGFEVEVVMPYRVAIKE